MNPTHLHIRPIRCHSSDYLIALMSSSALQYNLYKLMQVSSTYQSTKLSSDLR